MSRDWGRIVRVRIVLIPWYLAWRTVLQLHHLIRYSFLIAGHTKIGPDRCFGIIKKSYKLSYISSLYEFANMVETSSTGINKAHLVGTHDGTVLVPVYDWSSFLEQFFKKVPNIKKYQICKEEPGRVYFKELNSYAEHSLMLLKNPTVLDQDNKFKPSGL